MIDSSMLGSSLHALLLSHFVPRVLLIFSPYRQTAMSCYPASLLRWTYSSMVRLKSS